MNLKPSLFYQLMGCIYLIAFTSYYYQYDGLIGPNGLYPSNRWLNQYKQYYKTQLNLQNDFQISIHSGNLFVLNSTLGLTTEALLEIFFIIGLVVSTLISFNYYSPVLFFIAWLTYSNLMDIGQTWLSFQWDILLCECGFLCFITSLFYDKDSRIPLWVFRFLSWKLMFCSGVVKLQAKCPTWDNLSALEYHFASQCIPTPLAWFANQIPQVLLRLAVGLTLLIEIPLSFMLILPFTTIRRIGVKLQLLLQFCIFLTGNYNYFNLLTCVLMLQSWIDDIDDHESVTEVNQISMFPIYSYVLDLIYELDIYGLPSTLRNIMKRINAVKWMKSIQVILGVFIFVSSFTWMIKIELNTNGAWWNGNQISLRTKWADLKELVLPSSLFSIYCCISCLLISTSSIFMQSTTTKIFAVLSVFWKIIGFCVLSTMIFLSASTLNSICDINSNIPAFALSFRSYQVLHHITSSYGLFRRMTGVGPNKFDPQWNTSISSTNRPEIILEGYSNKSDEWLVIPFRYKPSGLNQSLPFIAPHQPRLDWQMWFAALDSYHNNPWLINLVYKLLNPNFRKGKRVYIAPEVLSLLDVSHYPFKDDKPWLIRGTIFDYDLTRFEDLKNNQSKSNWWKIENGPSEYFPPLESNNPSLEQYLEKQGLSPKQSYKSIRKQFNECMKLSNTFVKFMNSKIQSIPYFEKLVANMTPYAIILKSVELPSLFRFTHKQCCQLILLKYNPYIHEEKYYQTFFAKVFVSVVCLCLGIRIQKVIFNK